MRFSKLFVLPAIAGALTLGACGEQEPEVAEEPVVAPIAEPMGAPAAGPVGAGAAGTAFNPALDVNANGILDPDEGLGDADGNGILDRDEAYP